MYRLFDHFFFVFHGGLILFFLIGWIWRKTRRTHLVAIGLTFLSWFGLGIFFGWGYCPCTDWHWEVKRKIGETNLPKSYVKYYLDKLSGVTWEPIMVDIVVMIIGLLTLVLSIWLNLNDFKSNRN